ncbi:hypothetical protein GAYE_SCF68G6950 [Galdieria yellowstonensis]|uniref:Reverse transcriptase domain-containing protein n=1 Tax=Galdieria yellowstonensis TaxID=3028027 RepID=A0AAV9INA3_9RHOD|nr:hypothetical protein GAYE_SCF68G6950 [Galdieria yellowstonensis]
MSPSYGCFIDLRKAFDRVPHEALFRKLASLRIRGRCLEFYRGLYHKVYVKVILLLPLLFDLFINHQWQWYRESINWIDVFRLYANYRCAVIHGCIDKLVAKRIYFATSNPALWAMILDGNSNFAR